MFFQTVTYLSIAKTKNRLPQLNWQEFENDSLWHEAMQSNDPESTQEESELLPNDRENSPSISSTDLSKNSFLDMLEALGAFESGLPAGDPNQYQVEGVLGFIGKYQFAEPLLIDLGYYKANIYYGHGANKNHWAGTWTGKNGIDSKLKFLNSPDVQEIAIREAFALNWKLINDTLRGQGKSIEDYLGQEKTFDDQGLSKTIIITISGILAAAHLRGPYGVAKLLPKTQIVHDEFYTSILRYIDEYGGYDTTLENFVEGI